MRPTNEKMVVVLDNLPLHGVLNIIKKNDNLYVVERDTSNVEVSNSRPAIDGNQMKFNIRDASLILKCEKRYGCYHRKHTLNIGLWQQLVFHAVLLANGSNIKI